MSTNHRCAACGDPNIMGYTSVAPLCRECTPIIHKLLEDAHAAGGKVDILKICRKYFAETNSGGDYLLREIPLPLKMRVEHRAVDERCSVREIILRALEAFCPPT